MGCLAFEFCTVLGDPGGILGLDGVSRYLVALSVCIHTLWIRLGLSLKITNA